MSLVRKNIIANLIGSGWVALVSIAFIPLYIHFMGVEAYGLVGFYLTLQALFVVLDMGLTATVSRELARLSATNNMQDMRNLVRTLELIYWVIAVSIVVSVTFLAPWITTNWLNSNVLTDETVQLSIVLMGIIIALRMPYGFYSGGLLGLQRHILLNGIKITIETIKAAGAVLVLWLISPSIDAFFLWQLLIGVVGVVLIAVVLWRSLPGFEPPKFTGSLFSNLWRFAVGMSLTGVLSVILVQSDKVVLSKLLPLQEFGYYMLASTVSMGLYVIVGSVFSAIYPRFTQLVSLGDEKSLIHLYHKGSQLIAVLVMPLAAVVCVFSSDLLLIWTQNPNVAEKVAPILSLLIIGTSLNSLMNIPYALQLAYGWTKLVVYMNAIAVIILIPALIVVVDVLGAIGGALIWLCLNAGYLLFGISIMHRRLLTGEMVKWFRYSVFIPVIVTVTSVLLARLLMIDVTDTGLRVVLVGCIYLATLAITALSTPSTRILMLKMGGRA